MEYHFVEVPVNLPKATVRNRRQMKKLHLGDYSEVLVNVVLPESLAGEYADELYKIVIESNTDVAIFCTTQSTHMMFSYKVQDFSFEKVQEYCKELLYKLTEVDIKFANVERIEIQYGDAWYGEW